MDISKSGFFHPDDLDSANFTNSVVSPFYVRLAKLFVNHATGPIGTTQLFLHFFAMQQDFTEPLCKILWQVRLGSLSPELPRRKN